MSIKTRETLKSLQSQLAVLEVRRDDLKVRMTEIQIQLNDTCRKVEEIKTTVRKIKCDEITVSEHAIIRFIERVDEIDTEAIKREILSDDTIAKIRTLGNGKYPINEGKNKIVVKNNVVITVE